MNYCIGDIHGCYKTLSKLIEQILAQDQFAKFYFVGDLIDRGPDSKLVLDYIMNLKNIGKFLGAVKGNHEQMLVDAYDDGIPFNLSLWSENDGKNTLRNFDARFKMNEKVHNIIPEIYYSFIKNLPYFIETEKYFIVHAGFNTNTKSTFTDYSQMVWTRQTRYDSTILKSKKVIHGHTPITLQECNHHIKEKNLINIDTGCVYTQYQNFGFLTALNMDTLQNISIYNIDK